jgi:hypothetical protein
MKKNKIQSLIAALLAAALIVLIDKYTNRVDVLQGHAWDFLYYQDMVKNGLLGNDHLVAPYAYRFATFLLIRQIITFTHIALPTAFKALTYFCALSQLFGIYLLGRELKFKHSTSIVLMLISAFALFNIKFLLFDMYRAEHLAYPLLIFATIAFLRKRFWLVVLISVTGLQIRETLIIPAAIYFFYLLQEWWQNRAVRRPLIHALILFIVVSAAVILPRLLIPVEFSQQVFDSSYDPNFLHTLFAPKRLFNYFYNLIAFFLPFWLLVTRTRFIGAWKNNKPFHLALFIYAAINLFIMLFGGTDMMRYVSYFFIPQALLIGALIDNGIPILETIYMLIATFLFNKILLPFPIWDFSSYLNFHAGYGALINQASFERCGQIIAFFLIAILWRHFLLSQHEKPSYPQAML